MTALADEFTTTFREEHRAVRDALLDLGRAFADRDNESAQELLGEIAQLTGPHFRYEEESLYPALVSIFGDTYVESLLDDHDGAIASARRLVELAAVEPLEDEHVSEATRLIQGILPHVSDCDGLSIMVEVLPEETVESVFETRTRSLDEGLDLLSWADGVRSRQPVASP